METFNTLNGYEVEDTVARKDLSTLKFAFPEVTNMDEVIEQGFYSINTGNSTNTPTGASNYGMCIVAKMGGISASFINQVWIDFNSGTPKMFVRCYTGGIWQSWTQIGA